MEIKLSFENALKILKDDFFDDDLCYMGAVLFVAIAFRMSVDKVLEYAGDGEDEDLDEE